MSPKSVWTPPVVCPVCLLTSALPKPEAVVDTREAWQAHLAEAHSARDIMAHGAFVADAQDGQLQHRRVMPPPGPGMPR